MHFRYIFLVLVSCICGNLLRVHSRLIIDSVCKPPRGTICVEISNCVYFVRLLSRNTKPPPKHVIHEEIKYHQCGFNHNGPKVCCTDLTSQSVKASTKNEYKNLDLLPKSCGSTTAASGSRRTKRITNGNKAALMEFPWMALLTLDGLELECAGTLINERYVLTAAHCVVGHVVVEVRIGEYDVSTKIDCDKTTEICSPPVQEFYAEKIITHPQFNLIMLANDIALLRLNSSVDLSYENAKPVCLPFGKHAEVDLEGKYAVVTGWGQTEKRVYSAKLINIQVPIMSRDHCTQTFGINVTNHQLCVGSFLGRGSCFGDSGGPLMVSTTEDDGDGPKYMQHGIVSFGKGNCWNNKFPKVYTNVGSYIKWILENMKP